METIQTYGKRNKWLQEFDNIRYTIKPNKLAVNYLGQQGIGVYTPKMKTYKKFGLVFGIIFCLTTPATNWAIPLVVRWAVK